MAIIDRRESAHRSRGFVADAGSLARAALVGSVVVVVAVMVDRAARASASAASSSASSSASSVGRGRVVGDARRCVARALRAGWRANGVGDGDGDGGGGARASVVGATTGASAFGRRRPRRRLASVSASTKASTKASGAGWARSLDDKLRAKSTTTRKLPAQEEAARRLASGIGATICVRTVLAPLERVKIEYLLNRSALKPEALVRSIFTKEGLGGFWKGNLLNLARTAPYKAINFCAFDTYRGFVIKAFPEGSDGRKIGTLCAGAGAGVTAVLTCFPMDVLRTRLLTTGGKAKYGSLIQCVKTMYTQEGLSTFYRGITPALVSMAPNAAVYYTIYDGLKHRRMAQLDEELRVRIAATKDMRERAKLEREYPSKTVEASNMMLFGALAGVASEASTYPFEVIRRRMQMQGGRSSASMVFGREALRRMTVTLRSIVRKQGVRGLYAGLGPSCIQVLPSASLGFFSYEMFKLLFQVD